MMKFGKIQEVDAAKGRVKVRFDEDDLVSDWIPYVVPQTKQVKWHYTPIQGEHVSCMMDENCENGVMLGAVYSEQDTPNEDMAGKYVTFSVGETLIQVSDNAIIIQRTLNGPYIKMEGNTLTLRGGLITIQGETNFSDNVFVFGNNGVQARGMRVGANGVLSDGDITTRAMGAPINLSTHNHPTAVPGPPSPPTPGS